MVVIKFAFMRSLHLAGDQGHQADLIWQGWYIPNHSWKAESLWGWWGTADPCSNRGYHPFLEDPYWMRWEYHRVPLQGQGRRPWARKLSRPQVDRPGHEGPWGVAENFLRQQVCIDDMQFYRTGVLSDMEWLNATHLKYPDCVCIVESDTYPSPGVTRLCPSWLGTWLTWSPSGHCNMQWDTCYHLVAMAAGRELQHNHITRLLHKEYWFIYKV